MQATVPNQGLIRYLIENYYRGGINPQESQFVSSHWKHYGELFDVKVDAEGNLVSLSGKAFGTCKWGGLGHRFLDQLCVSSHLVHLSHRRQVLRLRAIAVKICDAMGLDPTFDVFRQVCSLELLQSHLPDHMHHKRMHVLMIGDGYGVLSALFKSVFPNSTVVMVDIGKTLLFQAYYCQKAHPECVQDLAGTVADLDGVDFVYCPTEDLATLEGFKFDIAVNIASMQEMSISTIARHFAFLRKCLQPNNLFYCCNRESKTLIGGEVSEFLKYPWRGDDRFLVDGYCLWHRYFFSRSRTKNGLCLFGVRVPFSTSMMGRSCVGWLFLPRSRYNFHFCREPR